MREHSFFLSVEKLKNTQKATLLESTWVWESVSLEMKPKALLLDKNFERGDKESFLSLVGFCHVYRFPLAPCLVYGGIYAVFSRILVYAACFTLKMESRCVYWDAQNSSDQWTETFKRQVHFSMFVAHEIEWNDQASFRCTKVYFLWKRF